MGYDISTGDLSSSPKLPVGKLQCLVSEALGSIAVRDTMWLASLAYRSNKMCHADWLAANSEVADVRVDIKVPSVDVLDIEGFA